jgi:Ulp1 family protease
MKLVDERRGNESALSQGWKIGQIKIELPRQKDEFNCGIYLLMFVEFFF